MSSFIDMYLDPEVLTAPVHSNPRFSTTITVASSGDEGRNRNWEHPLRAFTVAEGIRDQLTFDTVYKHWLLTGGPHLSWPFADPFDWASVDLEAPSIGPDDEDQEPPEISGHDQVLGHANGLQRTFQITKEYTRPLVGGGEGSYSRPIYLPRLDSLIILMNPNDAMFPGWYAPEDVPSGAGGPYTVDVSRPGGVVTFTPAPKLNTDMQCGFYFDTQVRFDSDDTFAGIVQSYAVSGYASVAFVETRDC